MKKTVKNIENVVISVQELTQIHSTGVENIRQINLFLQNKPNFPHFSPENEDYAKKQTQFKPNYGQNKANKKPNKFILECRSRGANFKSSSTKQNNGRKTKFLWQLIINMNIMDMTD